MNEPHAQRYTLHLFQLDASRNFPRYSIVNPRRSYENKHSVYFSWKKKYIYIHTNSHEQFMCDVRKTFSQQFVSAGWLLVLGAIYICIIQIKGDRNRFETEDFDKL